MTTPQAQPRPDIDIVNPNGQVSVREVVSGTLYFRQPHLSMRQEVADCIRRFFALVPAGGLEYHYDYDGEQDDINDAILARVLHERFFGPDSFPNASLHMEGTGLYAPAYFLEYLGSANDNPDLPNEAGTLQLWMPRAFFVEHRAKVLGFFAEAFATLPFSCGQIGLALSGEDKQRKQALAARYPGLDIAEPRCVSTDIGDKAGGVAWQTLLGPSLTASLGGPKAIALALAAPTVVEALPSGGVRITAEPEPRLGDVNRHDLLPSHRQVAQLLDASAQLHVPERVVYFQDRTGMADLDAMQQWHRRWL